MEPHPYIYSRMLFEQAFSSEECQRIVQLTGVKTASSVYDSNQEENAFVLSSIRRSDSMLLTPDSENTWLFQKLADIIGRTNQMYYHFDIQTFLDTQVLEYREGGFFNWHSDLGSGNISSRKLSVILFLSKPSEYEGGLVRWSPDFQSIPQEQGNTVVFPSYIPHQVEPVTKGVRHALVTWAHGPPFR